MLFRLIAAVLFTLAGACVGVMLSQRLRQWQDICMQIGVLLRDAVVCIRYVGMNVYDMVRRFRSSPELAGLTFLEYLPETFSEGENFREMWRQSLMKQEFPAEEREILAELGEMLGRTDIEGQLAELSVLEERVRCLENERRTVCSQKGRMYRSVGVLFGVMVGILVI